MPRWSILLPLGVVTLAGVSVIGRLGPAAVAPLTEIGHADIVTSADGSTAAVTIDRGDTTHPPHSLGSVSRQPNDPRQGSTIRGHVLALDDGRPLRRARVELTASNLGPARAITTGDGGGFQFDNLPPGKYRISASRSGYLRMSYGQRHPNEPGRWLDVPEGAIIDQLRIVLPLVGVISGRIVDEVGDPYGSVTVVAMRVERFQGRYRLAPVLTNTVVRSDETGQYRLVGLTPGEYYVRASSGDRWESEGPNRSSYGYVATFFPSASTPSEAAIVAVPLGGGAPGVDIQMIAGRAVRLSGLVIGPSGGPLAGERLWLTQTLTARAGTLGLSFGSAVTGQDGSFAFQDVPPGDYTVANLDVSNPKARRARVSSRVTLSGANVDGLTLSAEPLATARGFFVDDNGTRLTISPGKAAVRAQPVDSIDTMAEIGGWVPVGSDWSFELSGLFGRRVFRVTDLPDRLALRAVELGTQAITDTPIDASPTTLRDGLRIVLTNRVSRLTGVVRTVEDVPTPDAAVLAFAEDVTKWTEWSRFVELVRPDEEGRFEFRGLPAATYWIAALEYVDENRLFDPSFLTTTVAVAQRVSLAEGEAKSLALRIGSSR